MKKWYLNKNDFAKLREYRMTTMNKIAYRTGISLNTLFRMQREGKAQIGKLQKVAEYLNVLIGRDEKGIYFYIPDQVNDSGNKYGKISEDDIQLVHWFKKSFQISNIDEAKEKLKYLLKDDKLNYNILAGLELILRGD